jgi:hypothetical protein
MKVTGQYGTNNGKDRGVFTDESRPRNVSELVRTSSRAGHAQQQEDV